MKKLLWLIGAASLITSGGLSAVACSGWTPSGSINGGNSGGSEESNKTKPVNITETPIDKLDVSGVNKNEWESILKLYKSEYDVLKSGVDLLKSQEESASGKEKEVLKQLRLTMEVMELWYQLIVGEANFYLKLYDLNIGVDYNNNEKQIESILLVNDKLTLMEIKELTTNIKVSYLTFSNTWGYWWGIVEKEIGSDKDKQESLKAEKEKWEYLKDKVMLPKQKRHLIFTEKIEEKLKKL